DRVYGDDKLSGQSATATIESEDARGQARIHACRGHSRSLRSNALHDRCKAGRVPTTAMIKGSELQNREGVGESAVKEDPQEKLRILLERLARARRTNTGEDRH